MIDGASELMSELADRASNLILQRFNQAKHVTRKDDGSSLTETDLEIDQFVRAAVADRFPDHGYIGEETGYALGESEYTWICDPIDGTRPFTLEFPVSTFMLALLREGQPVLSVVAYPFLQRTYFAEQGKGAHCNGERIAVDTHETLEGAVIDVLCARRHAFPRLGIRDALDEKRAVCLDYGSTGFSAAAVARGHLSAHFWCSDTPWDAAAPTLLVKEAGGRVTALDGSEQRFDQSVHGYVATNGLIHDELLDVIASCAAAR